MLIERRIHGKCPTCKHYGSDCLCHEAQLRQAGYFSWGKDAWVHEDDEGTVLSTDDAIAAHERA